MKKILILLSICLCLVGCASQEDTINIIEGPERVHCQDLSFALPENWTCYEVVDGILELDRLEAVRSNVHMRINVTQLDNRLDWSDEQLLKEVEMGWDLVEVDHVSESEIFDAVNGSNVAHISVKWKNGDNWETFVFTLEDYIIRADFISDNVKGYDYYSEAGDILISFKREF